MSIIEVEVYHCNDACRRLLEGYCYDECLLVKVLGWVCFWRFNDGAVVNLWPGQSKILGLSLDKLLSGLPSGLEVEVDGEGSVFIKCPQGGGGKVVMTEGRDA